MTIPASEFALEMAGIFQACGADAGGKPKFGIVGQCQRFIIITGRDDAGNRPEYFLARDAHGIAGVGKQCRLQIKAGIFAIQAFATKGEFGTILSACIDIINVLIKLFLINNRTDMRA